MTKQIEIKIKKVILQHDETGRQLEQGLTDPIPHGYSVIDGQYSYGEIEAACGGQMAQFVHEQVMNIRIRIDEEMKQSLDKTADNWKLSSPVDLKGAGRFA